MIIMIIIMYLFRNVPHMKNCEPLVSFPRLAMDSRNALSCLRVKFSSVGSRKQGEACQRASCNHPDHWNVRRRPRVETQRSIKPDQHFTVVPFQKVLEKFEWNRFWHYWCEPHGFQAEDQGKYFPVHEPLWCPSKCHRCWTAKSLITNVELKGLLMPTAAQWLTPQDCTSLRIAFHSRAASHTVCAVVMTIKTNYCGAWSWHLWEWKPAVCVRQVTAALWVP